MLSSDPETCPHCGSPAMPISYGMPTDEAVTMAERGEIILAGCVTSPSDPTHGCLSCGSQWAADRDEKRTGITERFDRHFSNWDIHLPPGAEAAGRSGTIYKRGWMIRYLFGTEDGERFLEYYASHRMTNDRRLRIFESGREKDLEAIEEMYMYDPKVQGDEERAEREYIENNQRVARELKKLGLYPSGDVNTYLRTHDVPPPGTEASRDD
jgi:hypothetical protein